VTVLSSTLCRSVGSESTLNLQYLCTMKFHLSRLSELLKHQVFLEKKTS